MLSSIAVGPVQAIFIGDFSASSVLIRLPQLRTKGTTIVDNISTNQLPALSYNQIQSDWRKITYTLTFNSVDDNIIKLSRGLTLANVDPDSPPANNQYVVVLVVGNAQLKTSYYFPQINTKHNLSINLQKDNATEVPIEFFASNRDVSSTLIVKNTVAAIGALLGSRSPF